MATARDKKRSVYFSPVELEVLLQAYSEYEHIFRKKSNTAAAAKERESAWGKIASRVNACNRSAIKRTWQQMKMKYKNIIQSANRKRAEARKTGGGPAPPPLTDAEEMALSLNTGRPVAEGIPGGSSSEPVTPQDTSAYIIYSDGNVNLVEPLITTEPQSVDEGDEETLSADTERPTELPVKELYKLHLIKQLQKTDKELVYLDRQILKTDLEIELLRHKLEDRKKTK
ncbi:putative myb/SANT-like DNA-binding domain-containing protein 4-like [Triplophysa rosa]|uniref:Myb/SANT-like DNA-binding domain-containing protein 4-like n=1 Tax=Triplophysa rosa TaxID=992332 RepID=A0A9W7TPX4_TRIRA|nr:putative myb/SANT-like DNA-binding domain-containing protein 4-like [Triplophysa rosa]